MIVILGSPISSPTILSAIIAAECHKIHRKTVDSQHGFQSNLKVAVFSLWYFANLMQCVLFYHTPLCCDTSVYSWRSGIIKSYQPITAIPTNGLNV